MGMLVLGSILNVLNGQPIPTLLLFYDTDGDDDVPEFVVFTDGDTPDCPFVVVAPLPHPAFKGLTDIIDLFPAQYSVTVPYAVFILDITKSPLPLVDTNPANDDTATN